MQDNNPNHKKKYTKWKKREKGTHFQRTPWKKWWCNGGWKWGRRRHRLAGAMAAFTGAEWWHRG